MGKTQWRQVDGVVLLNKPLGLSSNQALQRVRRLYRAAKAGHTGALDPLATGMLPLCLGEATKFSQFLLDADKRYITCIELGATTTTGDKEGEVLSTDPVPVLSDSELETLLDRFRGDINQVPPMYSALKHEGKPLYEYARKGISIERKRRQVTIRNLSVIERTDNTLTLDITCSKGTYIRTIGEDIGDALGCGAHLKTLHRVSTAGYNPNDMLTLEEFEALQTSSESALDGRLMPSDTAVSHFEKVSLSDEEAKEMTFGRPLNDTRNITSDSLVRLFRLSDGLFLGLGIVKDRKIKAHRLINTSELAQK
ncbi:tRNA pseudouridine(55) synthase TruB [Marinomonas mediterranea]|jgi:tRNA pseudouridine synthase B (EC 4.2.1.70)|uniref:tRNA pseudouridine synthase B n=1 Tax=Marinomonas mediterranea (strain ATCC 700492 / JCM 21426 / NBRC 103028 / MMB-1) TaxID=717774 RepID=F2K4F7_MARM1|nr:tRNA pseudouridine(55) synthase TruB [Marinomonas mediterranea]ADZ90256.1 tRNA pseudouridine synthase B [Marinomonas mediterranea MMB-1]WCN16448.1 tRNA pseudouridine(55) synthase TruB [Marinomonas mediterranea MMB-1]